ncbi:hypothetical protein [Lysinibacillus sp. NPDC056185]|uniref:hypothetical protein n=1 Tax=Lysinibacillus sp. NPDC056185 TaxID=3345739 RepID=UPI0039EE17B8
MTGSARTGSAVSLRDRARALPRPGRSQRAKAEEREEHVRRDALHLLRGGRCAVCRERDESATRWLSYFVTESHTEEGTCTRVQASVGLCPAHTRRLLADASAPWLMPQLLDLALTGGTQLLGTPDTRRTRCPCCAAGDDATQRAMETLLRAFDHPPVREAVQDGAVCLPHLAVLATRVPHAYGFELAGSASAALDGERRETAWLAGTDEDACVRAMFHRRIDPLLLDEERHRQRSATSRWKADVGMDCCPLCLAEHRAARRLLTWTATATGRGGPAHEESVLCARHLHDLTAIGGPNVQAVLSENRSQWDARLNRFRRLLGEGRKGHAHTGPCLLSEPRCRACDEEREAVRRQAALLTAQLHDPVHAREYGHAHGICLRHALDWQGPQPPPVQEVSAARLALLRWEIDEALRKQDWHTRHEVKGGETSVSVRAPTLLDGRIYAGLPAPTEDVPATTTCVPTPTAYVPARSDDVAESRRPVNRRP